MQVDLFASLISSREIVTTRCLYNNAEDSLYQGFFQSQPASIRFQRVFPGCDEEKMQQEIEIMRTLKHEQILKLFDCFRLDSGVGSYLVVVTEFCANTAEKDMEFRRKAERYREENQLWMLIKQLISAFAYMQKCGFAHRCISPACLYIIKDSVSIGNFNASTTAPDCLGPLSIHGKSFYHSPKVYDAILAGHSTVTHNVYKSDLYSLGLTLLALANLKAPEIIALSGYEPEAVSSEVKACRYQDYIQKALFAMLEKEEENRMDFVQFEEWIGVEPVPVPALIAKALEEAKESNPLPASAEEEKSLVLENNSAKSEGDNRKGDDKSSILSGSRPTETTTQPPADTPLPGKRRPSKWLCCFPF